MSNLSILESNLKKLDDASKSIRSFLNEIIDENSFVETDVFMSGKTFIDGSDAMGEGIITGYATINENKVCVLCHNPDVFKGSVSKAQTDKILKCIDRAVKASVPLISIIDSAGARLGEGIAVLEGYASIISACAFIKEHITHICVVKGNAVGLMSSYATLADFVFISENGVISFNPPMAVIAGANKNLPSNKILGKETFTSKNLSATFSYKEASDLKEQINLLMGYVQNTYTDSNDDPNRTADILNSEVNLNNLTQAILDDGKYLELYKDFKSNTFTAFASINNLTVGVLATAKKLTKADIKKTKDFLKTLTLFNIPLVTLVDCEGIETSLEAEMNGLAKSVGKLFNRLSKTDIPKIAVIVGSAIGIGYAAFCSKTFDYDYVLALPNAKISTVSSEIAVTVNDIDEIKKAKDPVAAREKLQAKYELEEANPFVSAKDGYIDNIVEPALLRPYLCSIITMIAE